MMSEQEREITEWLLQAPACVRRYLQGHYPRNFLREERNRAFQIPRTHEGAISTECAERFKEQFEITDAMIKEISTWL